MLSDKAFRIPICISALAATEQKSKDYCFYSKPVLCMTILKSEILRYKPKKTTTTKNRGDISLEYFFGKDEILVKL